MIDYDRHSIILGPMLLHGDCTSDIYAGFGHHNAPVIGYDKLRKLNLGSDDEKQLGRPFVKLFRKHVTFCALFTCENLEDHLKRGLMWLLAPKF